MLRGAGRPVISTVDRSVFERVTTRLWPGAHRGSALLGARTRHGRQQYPGVLPPNMAGFALVRSVAAHRGAARGMGRLPGFGQSDDRNRGAASAVILTRKEGHQHGRRRLKHPARGQPGKTHARSLRDARPGSRVLSHPPQKPHRLCGLIDNGVSSRPRWPRSTYALETRSMRCRSCGSPCHQMSGKAVGGLSMSGLPAWSRPGA